MKPVIVVAYLRAVAASALRMPVGVAIIVAVNLLINPTLLYETGSHHQQIVAFVDRHAALWPVIAMAVALVLLIAPWACFRYAQWRYEGLDATALLPLQQREMALPIGRDDAFAIALRVLTDDLALYEVQADQAAGVVRARAVPLRSRSTTFGHYRDAGKSAATLGAGGTRVRDRRCPLWALRVADRLRLGTPRREIAISVDTGRPGTATIRIDARLRTLLPAIDLLARNRRHVDAIADAITARVQPLLVHRRELQESEQLQRRLLDARLQTLRAQIEPHFLYNTLANVQYLIRSDPPAATAMMDALIDYLRRALPKMRDAHSTLGEELSLLRAYLDILRIRMGSRLDVAIDAPAALLDHPFPPMMLLSLVENALKHGLEPKPGGGTITITAAADENALRVAVTDDGLGFGAEATSGTGIGLRNIRETLASMFGARAQMRVEARAGGGVVATIEVPRSLSQGSGALPLAPATTRMIDL